MSVNTKPPPNTIRRRRSTVVSTLASTGPVSFAVPSSLGVPRRENARHACRHAQCLTHHIVTSPAACSNSILGEEMPPPATRPRDDARYPPTCDSARNPPTCICNK